MRDGKVHLLLTSVIVVFFCELLLLNLLVVVKLLRKQMKFWEQGDTFTRETQKPVFFFFFFPFFSLFELGGDRSMPGQSGPGHGMTRGGTSG